jgi:superfamily II DNA or RNA helicase
MDLATEKVTYSKRRKLPLFSSTKRSKPIQMTFSQLNHQKNSPMVVLEDTIESPIDPKLILTIPIEGVNVGFPFKPYPLQRTIMSHIIKCIKKKRNGIFESPTGTGKTLMILASAIGWLLQETNAPKKKLVLIPQRTYLKYSLPGINN